MTRATVEQALAVVLLLLLVSGALRTPADL